GVATRTTPTPAYLINWRRVSRPPPVSWVSAMTGPFPIPAIGHRQRPREIYAVLADRPRPPSAAGVAGPARRALAGAPPAPVGIGPSSPGHVIQPGQHVLDRLPRVVPVGVPGQVHVPHH